MTLTRRDMMIGLAFLLLLGGAFAIDQPVARAMAGLDAHIVAAARFISWFGQGGVVLVPSGLLVLAAMGLRLARPAARNRLDSLIAGSVLVFATVAAAGIADDVLKIVFGRARPFLWLAGNNSGFSFFRYGAKVASFPSGHATTSFAAAIVFGWLFPRWRFAFAIFACVIAASRVAAGAHYPSDVVAGAALGSLVATGIVRQSRIRGRFDGVSVPKASAAGIGSVHRSVKEG